MNFVPNTVSELESSEKFTLSETTSSGIRIFTRQLTRDQADTIVIGSRDDEFLSDQPGSPFLFVMARGDELISPESGLEDRLDTDDVMEVLEILSTLEEAALGS